MNNADLPAMPTEVTLGESGIVGIQTGQSSWVETGLTKREYFAARILAGMAHELTDGNRPQHYDYAATSAVALADALLKALED